MATYGWTQGIGWGEIFKRILDNLYQMTTGAVSISFTPGAGSAPTAASNATIAVTGTAVQAIAAGSKGYILAAQGNTGSIFVGGATVTNGGANRGLELSPLGLSPLLTGPVFINGTAGDIGGVVTV